ncbi:3-beta-hydroxysteroid sulfotransferase-like isoform X1 [Ochotona curzoniae]|uniref:3-beta-hydroxysteroid sulfotransferase-like isoform X1 n=1 Tax=Ochotona curzoniae TaxID=130825 RepID=UPI001B34944B|nr:3-beta-hydroxysteroid sulfotransferase-like isoform X1 [Ochotona curzoniae]
MNEKLFLHEGILFPSAGYDPEMLRFTQEEFVFKDDDVMIMTYPKSGTNWLISILSLIRSKGDPTCVQSLPFWERAPWLETKFGFENLPTMKSPRLMTSHLPLRIFPKSIFNTKAKVIYLIRNPRDVLVSGYFFGHVVNLLARSESLPQYFEWFLEGNVVYGSWFDHIRGWSSKRDWENLLWLSYEELLQDTRGTVEKICHFMGEKLTPEEIGSVMKYSSFQFMKESKVSNFMALQDYNLIDMEHRAGMTLLRKGIAGDWKNHFTVAQAEAFDKIFKERTAGLPPELFPW